MGEIFMEKLLNGVEVEWKKLGKIGELVRGNGLKKKILQKMEYLQFIMDKFILYYPKISRQLFK
jgi:hypothetical protein